MTNIELDVPDFDMGTPRQQMAAHRNRVNYVQRLIDRGFDPAKIQLLLTVRCTPKWWLEADLNVTKFNSYFSYVARLAYEHGSATAAAKFHRDDTLRRQAESASSYQMSRPMALYGS